MHRIVLLRHAECLSANLQADDRIIPDESNALTEFGKNQAVSLGNFFKAELFKSAPKIFSSPIIRAEQTTEIIAEILNGSIEYFEELRERAFNFPDSFTINQSKEYQEAAHKNPHTKILDGESIAEHRARCVKWKTKYLDNATTDVLVVAHGGTIEQLFGAIIGSSVENAGKYFVHLDYCKYHLFSLLTVGTDYVWRLDKVNA